MSKTTSKSRPWETALKPAHEPIIMARKPLIGSVANNVMEYGTGALNINECRVPVDLAVDANQIRMIRQTQRQAYSAWGLNNKNPRESAVVLPEGRWPANVIHDGSDEVIMAFPIAPGQQSTLNVTGKPRPSNVHYGNMKAPREHQARGDSGSAARFFYCAKATKSDRNIGLEGCGPQYKYASTLRQMENTTRKGNFHPTVKPTELMRYLCKLVTPPKGLVLDPFMGTGTTGLAAVLEGFDFIGIEKEADYFEMAQTRIGHLTEFELKAE